MVASPRWSRVCLVTLIMLFVYAALLNTGAVVERWRTIPEKKYISQVEDCCELRDEQAERLTQRCDEIVKDLIANVTEPYRPGEYRP